MRRGEQRVVLNEIIHRFSSWLLIVSLVGGGAIVVWLMPAKLDQFVLGRVLQHPLGAVGFVSGGFTFGAAVGFALLRLGPSFKELGQLRKGQFEKQLFVMFRAYIHFTLASVLLCFIAESEGVKVMWAFLLATSLGIGVTLSFRYVYLGRKRPRKKEQPWG